MVILDTVSLIEGGSQYFLTRDEPHPEYDTETHVNNISLFEIDGEIEFFASLGPIPPFTEFTGEGIHISNIGRIWCKERENRARVTEGVICVDTHDGRGSGYGELGIALIAHGVIVGFWSELHSWGISRHLCTNFVLPPMDQIGSRRLL